MEMKNQTSKIAIISQIKEEKIYIMLKLKQNECRKLRGHRK